ncbi:MAG: DUF4173 domain-containing protein [Ginsengibacter sp.]
MKAERSKLILVITGAVIFNIIFWNEKPGVNIILFDVFICASAFYLYPYSLKSSTCRWLLAGHLITAAMVVIQNTMLSEIGFGITMLLFISFSQYIHRSAWYAGGSVLLNYVLVIPNFFRELSNARGKTISLSGWSRSARILLIPLFILMVFFIIYAFANTVFSSIAADVAAAIESWLTHVFDWFSFERFGFFLLGIFVVGGLVLRSRSTYFSDADMKKQNSLLRKKNSLKIWKESSFSDLLSIITGKAAAGIMALKNEFIMGMISLVLLNILLLFINIIDLKYVWLGFTFSKDANMAIYVHEGAWLLILSIILAMLLLLLFFRGNLNFYKKNNRLRYGAYLWIFQNVFLVCSVIMRDYYYIFHYGLAYRRIGLLFFLAMVLAGLLTVFLKICYVKTTYYLLRINAWVGILLLVLATSVHWDETIARYNLARKTSIPTDVHFLLSLSDKTLPLIEKNKDVLQKDVATRERYYYEGSFYNAITLFEYRKKDFLNRQMNYTWLSWNVTDAYVKKELSAGVHISSLK